MRLLAIALAFSLALAACVQVQLQANASVLDLGRIQVSINESIAPHNATQVNVSAVAEKIIPNNATVCIYGDRRDGWSENYFGAANVFDKPVLLVAKLLDEAASSKNYSDCIVVVIADDGVGHYMPLSHMAAVQRQVKHGAGLLVMGLGGARASDDASVFGWQVFGAFVPARVDVPGSKDPQPLGRATLNGVLLNSGTDPAFAGVGELQLQGAAITFVLPSEKAEAIAWVKPAAEALPTAPIYYAALRSCEFGRNCVYYLSFDAFAHAPAVANNTVRFLASEALGKYFVLRAFADEK